MVVASRFISRGRMLGVMRAKTWQWIGLAVGLLGFGLFYLDLHFHGPVSGADKATYDLIDGWEKKGVPVNEVGEWVSLVVSVPYAIAVTCVVVLAWWLLRARHMAVWASVAGLAAGGTIWGLKVAIRRPLPPKVVDQWYFSFPSGHTISAVANLGLLILLTAQVLVDRFGLDEKAARRAWKWTVPAWAAFALVMGVSRILTQRHWASDVYASWCVGLALTCAVLLVARLPWRPHLHAKGEPLHLGKLLRGLRGPREGEP